jgi:hypothetical protein
MKKSRTGDFLQNVKEPKPDPHSTPGQDPPSRGCPDTGQSSPLGDKTALDFLQRRQVVADIARERLNFLGCLSYTDGTNGRSRELNEARATRLSNEPLLMHFGSVDNWNAAGPRHGKSEIILFRSDDLHRNRGDGLAAAEHSYFSIHVALRKLFVLDLHEEDNLSSYAWILNQDQFEVKDRWVDSLRFFLEKTCMHLRVGDLNFSFDMEYARSRRHDV